MKLMGLVESWTTPEEERGRQSHVTEIQLLFGAVGANKLKGASPIYRWLVASFHIQGRVKFPHFGKKVSLGEELNC